MAEVVDQYVKGDRLKMRDKEIKTRQLRNRGMEYVTVTKVWKSQSSDQTSYDVKSHLGFEVKVVPHSAFEFISAKKVEAE